MSDAPRYRVENGESIVDVRLTSIEQLFDNRDPAPFRERDLDPQLVEYLVDVGEDLVAHARFRIIFWLDTPCALHEIEVPYRAHLQYELSRTDRVRRRHRRAGWFTLGLAFVSIVILVSLSELVGRIVPGTLGAGLREGLLISGWVLMWRPIEVLVYDSIPWRRSRRVLQRLIDAPIEVARRESAP